jgi:HlyD family secretion protein
MDVARDTKVQSENPTTNIQHPASKAGCTPGSGCAEFARSARLGIFERESDMDNHYQLSNLPVTVGSAPGKDAVSDYRTMAKQSGSRGWKWLVALLLIAVVAGGTWYYFKGKASAPQYQTAEVVRGDLTQVVTATGGLNPVVNVQVGSQISGIVKRLFVDFNSVVKSNQVVAQIDPSSYQINVLKAEADLANAKATLELNQVEARRAEQLYNDKLISASDHDTAIAQLHQAQAVVQSDEAILKNAQVQLSYCTIVAPVDGVVISRNVDVGQTVAASFNTPTIFTIANDLSKMQIDALVSEADIGGVATNQHVNFTVDAYPYRTFRGTVSQIRYGPLTNQNVVCYDAVVGVDNSDLKLLPGMTANVSIVLAERENALKIPNAALRFRPPGMISSETRSNGAASPPESGTRPSSGGGGANPGRSGAGGPGGGGFRGGPGGLRPGGGGPGDFHPERASTRTVYLLDTSKGADQPELKPVKIKVGISDGASTEVVEGLKEGDRVVIGTLLPDSDSARPTNPFGGGRRF